jgi:hypothetical protein
MVLVGINQEATMLGGGRMPPIFQRICESGWVIGTLEVLGGFNGRREPSGVLY